MVLEVQQLEVVPSHSLLVSSMMDDLEVEVSEGIQRALRYYHTEELDQYSSECFLVSNREMESSNIEVPSTHLLTCGPCIVDLALVMSWKEDMIEESCCW